VSAAPTSRAPRAGGFTLLEVMIAVAITAMLGAMTLGAFRQVDRARELTEDQGDRYGAAARALSRMADELQMAFLSDHYDRNRFRDPPTLFTGREERVLFCTFAHERLARDARESDQAVIEYTLESDPDHSGEQALFRREKARIDEQPDRGGSKDLVADHLASFSLEYWDPKRKDWSREWSTRSVDHAGELPARVRLTAEVKLADGRTEKLSTEARIAITRPLSF
jgi:general secretion pathway protein J